MDQISRIDSTPMTIHLEKIDFSTMKNDKIYIHCSMLKTVHIRDVGILQKYVKLSTAQYVYHNIGLAQL